MEKVQVLLSAYNGESYIEEQLDSLLGQKYPNVNILVRDDGSADRTCSILEEYTKKYDSIEYYTGENKGAWRSFFDLMERAEEGTQYFAFCDQDDYWLPDKLQRAIEQLEGLNSKKPLLYCSETIPVNEKLEKIHVTIKNHKIRPAFGNAMVENICTGCTAVINRRLLELIVKKIPEYTNMHDWWMYLVASCFGEVYYDRESHIYYRQHGKNEIGARITRIEETMYHLQTYHKRKGRNYRQLEEFNRLYHVTGENKELLELILDTRTSFGKKIRMVKNKKIFRQRRLYDILYKGMVLMGDV